MLLDLVKSSRSFRGFCRDQEDVHYVPKRTLEELILNK